MDYFAELIITGGRLNGAIVGAVLAAVAAVLGVVVGRAISKVLRKDAQAIQKWTVILFVVCSFQIPRLIRPYLTNIYEHDHQTQKIDEVMDKLQENRLYSVIFSHIPEARSRLAAEMRGIVFDDNVSDAEVQGLSQQASGALVNEYLAKYLPLASDDAVKHLIDTEYDMMLHLRPKPDVCVGYFSGRFSLPNSDIPVEMLAAVSDGKADILLSGIESPSVDPRVGHIDEALNELALGYKVKGYNVDNVAKLSDLETLDSQEGCNGIIEFYDVLASMDATTASFVMKSLFGTHADTEVSQQR